MFEVGTRVPLIVAAPGKKGGTAPAPVMSIDIYPTLCELCGLPVPAGLQGHSLVPLLADPTSKWDHPAVTVAGNRKNLGVAVRTKTHRYAEWAGGTNGAMLFDEAADPDERTNRLDDPKLADVRKRLAELARAVAGG